jgi:DNA-binding response OmpR family regulator
MGGSSTEPILLLMSSDAKLQSGAAIASREGRASANRALPRVAAEGSVAVMRVLVVEDEKKTASFVRKALQAEGFAVDVLHDGAEALSALTTTPFDVAVLDVMLPGRDGLSVVRQMRERGVGIPVLLLTARGEVSEKVEGLNAGADDYLPKPFALAELVARVRALGRRTGETKAVTLRVGELVLNTVTRTAHRGEKAIDLAPREYLLLEYLMRSAGRICGRMAIVEKVWDYDFDPGTNLVDVYIKRLREKIDADFETKLLHTVRGVGYVMKEHP